MGGMSIWHWLIVLLVVVLLFGAGKIPRLMGDVAKGIKAFKSGLKEGEADGTQPPATTPTGAAQPAQPAGSTAPQQTAAADAAQPPRT